MVVLPIILELLVWLLSSDLQLLISWPVWVPKPPTTIIAYVKNFPVGNVTRWHPLTYIHCKTPVPKMADSNSSPVGFSISCQLNLSMCHPLNRDKEAVQPQRWAKVQKAAKQVPHDVCSRRGKCMLNCFPVFRLWMCVEDLKNRTVYTIVLEKWAS
jgi:hypothetical protein